MNPERAPRLGCALLGASPELVEGRAKHVEGFTFVELLLAATIFAILGIGVVATFNSGVATWRTANRTTEAYRRGEAVLRIVERDFANAVTIKNNDVKPSFADDHLSFVTIEEMPDASGQRMTRRLRRVLYQLEEHPDHPHPGLVRKAADYPADPAQTPTTYDQLLADVAAFKVEYAHPVKTGEQITGVEWQDAPVDETLLPRAIKIGLTFAAGQREWSFVRSVVNPMGWLEPPQAPAPPPQPPS